MKPRITELEVPEGDSRYIRADLQRGRERVFARLRARRATARATLDRAVELLATDADKLTQAAFDEARLAADEAKREIKAVESAAAVYAAHPEREPIPLRLPSPARTARIDEWARGMEAGDMSSSLYHAGALVGVAWSHPRLALEAEWPVPPTDADLYRFADQVLEELAAEGFTRTEVLALATELAPHTTERAADLEEGRKMLDFFDSRAESASSAS